MTLFPLAVICSFLLLFLAVVAEVSDGRPPIRTILMPYPIFENPLVGDRLLFVGSKEAK